MDVNEHFFPLPFPIKQIDGKPVEIIWCYYLGTSFLEKQVVLKRERLLKVIHSGLFSSHLVLYHFSCPNINYSFLTIPNSTASNMLVYLEDETLISFTMTFVLGLWKFSHFLFRVKAIKTTLMTGVYGRFNYFTIKIVYDATIISGDCPFWSEDGSKTHLFSRYLFSDTQKKKKNLALE